MARGEPDWWEAGQAMEVEAALPTGVGAATPPEGKTGRAGGEARQAMEVEAVGQAGLPPGSPCWTAPRCNAGSEAEQRPPASLLPLPQPPPKGGGTAGTLYRQD
jgi:hypothetical protein